MSLIDISERLFTDSLNNSSNKQNRITISSVLILWFYQRRPTLQSSISSRPETSEESMSIRSLDYKMSSFNKSNENIHKKEDGSYYVVSANKASSVTL